MFKNNNIHVPGNVRVSRVMEHKRRKKSTFRNLKLISLFLKNSIQVFLSQNPTRQIDNHINLQKENRKKN